MSETITDMLSGMLDDIYFLIAVDEKEKLSNNISDAARLDLQTARIILLSLANSLANRYRKKYPDL